jgi:demethylmenaquinone methyltransferase/2-methoxy-6-polyprenyl-1,4-benzoquinol methylase
MFGRIVPRYDLLNRLLSLGLDQAWRRRTAAAAALERGDRAIDLGCGTGDLTAELARRVGQANVVGVDFSAPMLERARRKYPGIRFLLADALQVPLEEASFTACTCAFTLRNVASVEALFGEMRRLVAPGGRVLALELTRPQGLLGWFHGLYLRLVVPLVGWLVSGDFSAYSYLARSIAEFLSPSRVAQAMRRAGLEEVRVLPLSGGVATLFVGVRPR